MKKFLLKLFYADGVVSKTKVTAVLGLVVNGLAAFGVDVPGLADNLTAINATIVMLLGLFLRDGIAND